jgi:transglutaminase-like putative cysteine protease
MNYDIRLQLEYAYEPPVVGGRHLVRVAPAAATGGQRVVAASIVFDPAPFERTDGRDFFGNSVVSIGYRQTHATLRVGMSARVRVDSEPPMLDVSPDLPTLRRDLAGVLSLAPGSPHHFVSASPRVPRDGEITAYAGESLRRARTVQEIVRDFGERIHRDFRYDKKSTEVETSPRRVFELKRGVCQDFSHLMIAGLRGIGIPAAYVSGFLRTIPPPGAERLEGTDAMHAWVRAWCGREAGWVGYDPTNRTFAGESHIVAAVGRDYQDVSPIAGVLRTSGTQKTSQKVDVVPVDPAGAGS